MTVAEIKAQLPGAEVYELNPASRYIIVLNRNDISQRLAERVSSVLAQNKIAAWMLRVDDPDNAVRVLEISE